MITAASLLAAEGNNPLIPHTYELVVGIFSFAVVVLVVGKMLVPRIQKTLEERTEAIEGGLKRAESAQAEAEQTLEQYRSQLAEARHEAARLREQAREQGAQIIAEMREQAQVEARRITESAQAQIEAERQQALTRLRAEVGELAVELASRVVGESLEDEARQRRTVDRFLEELEERTRTQAGEQVS
ncbi:F0F1 ATP synthase subunit B [Actinomadura alba]|uniref:ATP synthase subunit b n=1 Tax=Actinomadura alba TaxID=406431 RepID=A0ABR7LM55_9ACTN|nr:F0F1 ATP synthase subunit B [Actinomadura alba]MBC6465893.1 F0F1 ATP synthase subunit B [Actinomadura alba]